MNSEKNRPGPLTYAALVLAAIVALFPIYWLVLSSFKKPENLSSPNPLPYDLTTQGYSDTVSFTEVPIWLLNSLTVAVCTTLLGLVLCSLAGFAFARYRFRGRGILFWAVVATLAIPDYVTVLPVFEIERRLGLLNTLAGVIVPLSASALGVFLLRQYFKQLPEELFDALRVDGGSEWLAYWRIGLPLVRPGLGAAGLLIFLSSWNAYLLPLVVLRSNETLTMPVGLSLLHSQLSFAQGEFDPWTTITVATTLSVLPLAICLIMMQRQFVSSLTVGALK